MQRQIQDPIKHQDTELFAKTFNGFNQLNTFTKVPVSGVWQSPEGLWETFNSSLFNSRRHAAIAEADTDVY